MPEKTKMTKSDASRIQSTQVCNDSDKVRVRVRVRVRAVGDTEQHDQHQVQVQVQDHVQGFRSQG
jgi:hypothetical protein